MTYGQKGHGTAHKTNFCPRKNVDSERFRHSTPWLKLSVVNKTVGGGALLTAPTMSHELWSQSTHEAEIILSVRSANEAPIYHLLLSCNLHKYTFCCISIWSHFIVCTLWQKVRGLGLRSLKAYEFKKWGRLQPSSLIKVYTFVSIWSRKLWIFISHDCSTYGRRTYQQRCHERVASLLKDWLADWTCRRCQPRLSWTG